MSAVEEKSIAQRGKSRPARRHRRGESSASESSLCINPDFGSRLADPDRESQRSDLLAYHRHAPRRPKMGNVLKARIQQWLRHPGPAKPYKQMFPFQAIARNDSNVRRHMRQAIG